VLPGSAAAFRPLERVGYIAVGDIRMVRLGPWRRVRRRLLQDAGSGSSAYWDAVLDDMRTASPMDAWRGYMRRVYAELIGQWLPSAPAGLGLKTDLFEEAVTHHEVLSALGPGSVGVDVSPAVAIAARRRLGERDGSHRFIVGDLRQAPLRSGSVARVLAGSSLDHFAEKADIAASLAELARLLVPGGVLLLTLDNPHNPAIWLRNHLPFVLLKGLRLVPYYVGATYGRTEARAHLESLGFRVTHVAAVAHAPRAPAVWLAALIDRHRRGLTPARLERLLWSFEALGRWPTRHFTGYYLALRAVRRHSAAPET
jgi:SAM-dependent methyltransferase